MKNIPIWFVSNKTINGKSVFIFNLIIKFKEKKNSESYLMIFDNYQMHIDNYQRLCTVHTFVKFVKCNVMFQTDKIFMNKIDIDKTATFFVIQIIIWHALWNINGYRTVQTTFTMFLSKCLHFTKHRGLFIQVTQ